MGQMIADAWNQPVSRHGDMTFSSNKKLNNEKIIASIEKIIFSNGFNVNSDKTRIVYKLKGIEDNGEFWIIENREGTDFDAGIYGTENTNSAKGILIWHIDEDLYNSLLSINAVNSDMTHRAVDIEEASGEQYLDQGYSISQLAFWTNSITGFSDISTPNSKYYNNNISGVNITKISESKRIMTFSTEIMSFTKYSVLNYPNPFNPNNGSFVVSFSLQDVSLIDDYYLYIIDYSVIL